MDAAGRETVVKNKFGKSIGTGLKSLTTGGREFYILEHKTNSKNFRAGTQKEIIVDYIEFGRDPNCAVRYSEQEQTVSRRHAAINKEGDTWVLLNLSQTNPTLLNGRPVANRYYLSSGDEIQLSVEGPRIGFIIPSNNKTGSLSIGRRMTLFREQALRPYKRALAGLAALLVVISVAAGFFIYNLNKENVGLKADIQQVQKALQDTVSISQERADSLKTKNEELAQQNTEAQNRISSLSRQLRSRESSRRREERATTAEASRPSAARRSPGEISELYPDVFLVKVTRVKITQSNGEVIEPEGLAWSGTGFLTKDNRFVTARHVVEPWFYPLDPEENPDLILINILIHNYGSEIDMSMEAVSSGGQRFSFTLRDFRIDRALDQAEEAPIDGQPHVLRHALNNPNDIAWAKVQQSGTLVPKPELSASLRATQELYILGYPLGFGATNPADMAPIYSTATVARPGLENGSIITTDNSIEYGNSGGPVFIQEGGVYEVIGVVSGGWGQNIGKIVPISLIY